MHCTSSESSDGVKPNITNATILTRLGQDKKDKLLLRPRLTKEQEADLEMIQLRAFQIILGRKLRQHEYDIILTQTGTETLVARRTRALLNFGIKIIRSTQFRYMFTHEHEE